MTKRHEEQFVDLKNLCDGAAEELFSRELERVVANILDPNTKSKEKRAIVLTFGFHPDEERSEVAVSIQSTAKLSSNEGAATRVFVGKRAGKFVAVEYDPKQMGLFNSEEPVPFESINGGKGNDD